MRLLRERYWRWSAIRVCDFSEKDVGRLALDNGLVGLENGPSRAREKAWVAGKRIEVSVGRDTERVLVCGQI
jgi:hypothetical protein